MKSALFASCAPAVGAFRALEGHCGGKTHDLRYFDAGRNDREVLSDLRRRLNGGAIGIVSFGDDGTHDHVSLRAAQVAAQRGHCALVITSAGYFRLMRMLEDPQLLPLTDSGILRGVVTCAILVGKDQGASFSGFEAVFPRAKPFEIGGFGWALNSCHEIVAYINGTKLGGSLA